MPIRNGKWNVTIDGAIGEMEVAAVTWILTGYFDAAPDAGGSPRRGRYGWYATARETV